MKGRPVRAPLVGWLPYVVAATFNGETTGHVFTLNDFRIAFLLAGIVTMLSIWGYARLAHDAGKNVGGGSRRQRA